MRSNPETTRAVRSWLEEGRTRLPDSVLDAVLDQLPATRQRRSRWPARRIANVNLNAKVLLAAAAVVAVAVIGINVLPGVAPGPAAQVSPSPTLTLTPTPTVAPTTPALHSGTLDAGTYRLAEPEFTRLPFTITVPDGWSRSGTDGNFVHKGTGAAADAFDGDGTLMATWIVSHVYAESCQWDGTLEAVPTIEDVVRALADQTGHDTVGPTATSLGGRPATRFELSVPVDFDPASCDNGFSRLWPDAGPEERFGLPINPGHVFTVYVVDVEGKAQLIIAIRKESSLPADVAELDQVIGSLQFDE